MRIDEVARDDHRPLRLDGLHVAIVHPHGTHMAAEGRIRQPRGGRMLGLRSRRSAEQPRSRAFGTQRLRQGGTSC